MKAGKAACGLVDTPSGYGSPFCVDAGGYFVTNEHVLTGMGKGSKHKIVLNDGEKDQVVADAVVVRTDPAADLALLKVDAKGRLPILALGDDEKRGELDELIGFGFPFGKEIVKSGDYPSIAVSAATISSFRSDKDRRLDRIQMDAALNPGNSGRPVVNRSGSSAPTRRICSPSGRRSSRGCGRTSGIRSGRTPKATTSPGCTGTTPNWSKRFGRVRKRSP